MVSTTVDPMRIVPVNLSPAEIEEIQELMEVGALPRDFLDRHYEAVEKNVFGHDHKKDRHGEPIENGIGTPQNMTANAVNAYIKNQTERRAAPEDGYEETLKRMQADLAKCDAIRKEKALVARGKKARKN